MPRLWTLCAAALALAPARLAAQPLRGRYFMVVFAYQGSPNLATRAHTFASFLDGAALDDGRLGAEPTISWLPAAGRITRLFRQQGRNYALDETLDLALRDGSRVAAWGPFEIDRAFYEHALRRIGWLESGAVDYKMIPGPLSAGSLNCIHAVGELGGELFTGTLWGFEASAAVVAHLSPWIIGYPAVHGEAARRMRLRERIEGRRGERPWPMS